jgi:hypothetical protein
MKNWFEQENTENAEVSSLLPPRPPVPKLFICIHLGDLRADAFLLPPYLCSHQRF